MATLTREKIRQLKESSHNRYTQALELPYVRQAITRIFQLYGEQGDRSLWNTDTLIEYTALVELIHAIAQDEKRTISLKALEIWMELPDMALTAATFNPAGYSTVPSTEAELTLQAVMRADVEQRARDKDAKILAMVIALQARGELQDKAVIHEEAEHVQRRKEREKPIDVASIVASVTGGDSE